MVFVYIMELGMILETVDDVEDVENVENVDDMTKPPESDAFFSLSWHFSGEEHTAHFL